MAVKIIPHLSVEERRAKGKDARERAPLTSHRGWSAVRATAPTRWPSRRAEPDPRSQTWCPFVTAG